VREPSRREGDSFPKSRAFGNDLHQYRAIATMVDVGRANGDGERPATPKMI